MKELERALLSDGQAGERVAVLGVLREGDPGRVLSLLFWVLADDLIAPWHSDEIAALLKTVDEQLRRVTSEPDEDWWGVRVGADMAIPALRRLASSGVTPMREAAASVVARLRVFRTE